MLANHPPKPLPRFLPDGGQHLQNSDVYNSNYWPRIPLFTLPPRQPVITTTSRPTGVASPPLLVDRVVRGPRLPSIPSSKLRPPSPLFFFSIPSSALSVPSRIPLETSHLTPSLIVAGTSRRRRKREETANETPSPR